MTTLILPPPRRPSARWPRRVAAAGALAAGLASLFAALEPALDGLLRPLTVDPARFGVFDRVLVCAAAAAALLVARGVSRGTFRGRRRLAAGVAAAAAAGTAATAGLVSVAHPLHAFALPGVIAGIVTAYLAAAARERGRRALAGRPRAGGGVARPARRRLARPVRAA